MPVAPGAEEFNRLLPVLWQLLLDRVDLEWVEKYGELGASRHEITQFSTLGDALFRDLSAHVTGENIEAITATTLSRSFHQDGWAFIFTASDLRLLLNYLGFRDWRDFRQQCGEDDPSPEGGGSGKRGNPWFYLGP